MTREEIITKATAHLLAQNLRSMNHHGKCAYRGYDGRKCAVGIFVSDEWAEAHEGLSINSTNAPDDLRPHLPLLSWLQAIHDNHSPEEWPELLDAL